MYKAFDSHLENESKDDEGSLSSSFWTDRESEGEDRDYVKKENRRIEREPERDSNDEKEIFVIGDDKKERMKKTLQGNELEKKKYVQAETNPKADEDGSEVERECFIEDEMEKGIEVTRTDQEKEEEEEKGKENEEEEESEDEEEDSEDEEKELEEEEEESEEEETGLENEEEEESEAEEKEFEEEEQKGKESEEEETGHESEEEEIIKEHEEESQVEGEEEQESEEVKKGELAEEEEEEKRKESEEKEESEEEKGEASDEEEREEVSQEEESEEEEEGSRDEEEEFELCKQEKGNKKKEEEDLEESEEEEDNEEEKESSVNGENSEENKAQSNDSESEKYQLSVEESEEEESFPKDSNSEEKCTDKESNSDEKKEGITKEESTGGSGEEEQDEEEGEENEEGANVSEDNEGIEDKIDGGKSFVRKESTGNSESEGSENSKLNEREPKNEEDMNDEEEKDFFAKDSTEENPDSNEEQERNGIGDGNSEEEERECFINEYDKEIELGKSDEKDEDISSDVNLAENRSGADEHESGMEVFKGGSKEKEEVDWFFDGPVGGKESWDQDRKSWASDDDYVTISSGHSQNEEEDNHNMLPAWEEEPADVRQKKETRDIYDEDYHESLGSPAASILTSGYGTYRPDSSKDGDPEEVDYRDDCTLAGLEEESESILDAHDYEENSSLVWFGDDQALETSDGGAPARSPDDRKDVAVHCTDQSHDGCEDDGHQFPDTPSKGHEADPQQTPTGNDIGTQDGGSQNVAYFNDGLEVEALRDSLDHPFNLRHMKGRVQRRPEEKQNDDGYDDVSKGKRVRVYTGCLGVLHSLQGFA